MFLDAGSSKRPDIISEFTINNVFVRHALDLTIVSPFAGVQTGELNVTAAEVGDPNKKANQAAQVKITKYKHHCEAANYRLVPFVIYTTGKLHETAKRFLQDLAKYSSRRRNVKETVLYNYYVKLISVSLVKRIGYVISNKSAFWLAASPNPEDDLSFGNQRANEIGNTAVD